MIRNLFFFNYLGFGGTEQFLYEMVKKYAGSFNIVVAFKEGASSQVARLARLTDVIKWHPGMKIECQRAFLNYNIEIIDDLICDDIILVNHANFEKIRYKPPTDPRIRKVISVSEFAAEIYRRHYSTPCEVSYNPISIEDYERPLILMSAFRGGDPVRGAERCRILAEHLDASGKRYLWIIFSDKLCEEIDSPNVMVLPQRSDVRAYMQLCDWGISLPDDMETFGYTNIEFLMYGKPIVTTPLSVCDELNIDSSMRLVCEWDMSNADEIVEMMFTKKMKFSYSPPEDRWDEILAKGKGSIEERYRMKIYRVKANDFSFLRKIHLSELGRPAKPGEVFETTEDRLDNLIKGDNRWNEPFAELIGEVKKEEPAKEEKKKTTRKKAQP